MNPNLFELTHNQSVACFLLLLVVMFYASAAIRVVHCSSVAWKMISNAIDSRGSRLLYFLRPSYKNQLCSAVATLKSTMEFSPNGRNCKIWELAFDRPSMVSPSIRHAYLEDMRADRETVFVIPAKDFTHSHLLMVNEMIIEAPVMGKLELSWLNN